MPEGWALQTQSCTRYLIVLAKARTHKSLAQSYTCKTHCGYHLLVDVPFIHIIIVEFESKKDFYVQEVIFFFYDVYDDAFSRKY